MSLSTGKKKQDPRDTVKLLRPAAYSIARHIKDWHGKHGNAQDFGWWHGKDFEAMEWKDQQSIEYACNKHATVTLTNIRVADIEDIEFGPLEKTGKQEPKKAHIYTVQNTTDMDMETTRTFTEKEEETRSVGTEIGLAVEAGFRQKLNYGNAFVQGETEISLSVSASYAKHEETTSTHSFEVTAERHILEKAMTRTVFDRTAMVGPARRKITTKGLLEFGVRIWSHNDWTHQWSDRTHLRANLAGIDSGENWAMNFYRNHRTPNIGDLAVFGEYSTTLEFYHEFQDVNDVTVTMRQEPISS